MVRPFIFRSSLMKVIFELLIFNGVQKVFSIKIFAFFGKSHEDPVLLFPLIFDPEFGGCVETKAL